MCSYTKIDNAVLDDDSLPRSCKAVFVVLCRHAHNDDKSCWLSQKTIAEESKYSDRTVRGALKKLEQAGLIVQQHRFDKDGSRMTSLFVIIGGNAKRYQAQEQTPPPEIVAGPSGNDCRYNKNPLTTKDSLTRPENTPESDDKASIQDAPGDMRATAEYLLLKTGRESLTQSEISSLRELNATQYPARVQKEIDKACERFKRKKRDLLTLSFNYIAGALRNQPSRKLTGHKNVKPDLITQGEIKNSKLSDDEMAEIERRFNEYSGGAL